VNQYPPLLKVFDAVVMLTWSNWHNDPRSNQYHYATLFSKHLPVLLVQPDAPGTEIVSERVPGLQIEILHVPEIDNIPRALEAELAKRGICRPLLWIYNPSFKEFVVRSSSPLRIYRAVEDYLCGPETRSVNIRALLQSVDLVVAVSEAVGNVCRSEGNFAGEVIVLPDGSDDELGRGQEATRHERSVVSAQSHDARFSDLLDIIEKHSKPRHSTRPRLNVLMLYDDRSTHVRTIKEHLDAFSNYSHHRYHFLPATRAVPGIDNVRARPDFGFYDAIAIHYSVRVSLEDHLSLGVADLVSSFCGPKLLFIQDEYENSEVARRWIERLGINAVFTNVPLDQVEKVYSRNRFPNVDFIPTLTGYVPEDPTLDELVTPLAERKIVIGYRGRQLPHHYGQLGYEKYLIGTEMKRRAEKAGISADIEFDESHRIYGIGWYRFLASCQATLGSESGANVFDDDGSLRELALRHSKMSYHDFVASHLKGRDDFVRMNQISPKIFEAIRLRTALILFEGNYSGIVKPDQHYIPLKKDFSNVAEVFAKVSDLRYLEALTARAYEEIIATGRYSYATFVDGIDHYIERQCPRGPRATIFSAPVIAHYREGGGRVPIDPASPLLLDGVRIESVDPRSEVIAIRQKASAAAPAVFPAGPVRGLIPVLLRIWRRLPARNRQLIWRTLPISLRRRLRSLS
jgi:hypothetical protein